MYAKAVDLLIKSTLWVRSIAFNLLMVSQRGNVSDNNQALTRNRGTMTNIVGRIVKQIKDDPEVDRIVVSKVEWLLIKREIGKLSNVRPNKRPTGTLKNNPWLYSDQAAWDAMFKQKRDYAQVYIMGKLVTWEP